MTFAFHLYIKCNWYISHLMLININLLIIPVYNNIGIFVSKWNIFTGFDWSIICWGRCGRDRMVVGFTTTYAVSVYHHWCCEFESRSGRGIQHYVIKFVRDSDRSVVSSTNKTYPHDISEILLKVALKPSNKQTN